MLGRNADLKCVGYAMQGVVRTSRGLVDARHTDDNHSL